jgi:hypothetical protein
MDDDLTGQFSTSESYEEHAKLGVVSIARVKSENGTKPLGYAVGLGIKKSNAGQTEMRREKK